MTLYHTDPPMRLSFILIDKILYLSFLGLVEDPRTILRSMNDLLIEALEKHWYIYSTNAIHPELQVWFYILSHTTSEERLRIHILTSKWMNFYLSETLEKQPL